MPRFTLFKAEAARTRGTPVTVESFRTWKAKFDKEISQKKSVEEEEKLKALTPKEREEYKKYATRLTGTTLHNRSILKPLAHDDMIPGRQLFERNRHLEDESLMEEGTVSVDVSQYERTRVEEQEENEGVTFSDSD